MESVPAPRERRASERHETGPPAAGSASRMSGARTDAPSRSLTPRHRPGVIARRARFGRTWREEPAPRRGGLRRAGRHWEDSMTQGNTREEAIERDRADLH